MNTVVRTLLILFVIGILIVIGGVAAFVYLVASPSSSATALRDYVARQIVAIVNTHLEPTLDYDKVELELPGTVRLTGASLTSPDGTSILDIDTLVVTLVEVPQLDQPIHIARVEIDGGRVNLIQDPATGQFKGLQPLVKPDIKNKTAEVPSELSLSKVLQLEHVTLKDIALQYDDGSGITPMLFEGFEADLAVTPSVDGPGWYSLAVHSGRAPGLVLDIEGAFNIDTFVAKVNNAASTIELNDSTITTLPPQVQSVVRSMDVSGFAQVDLTGFVPLQAPLDADVKLDIELTNGNIAAGDYKLPVKLFKASVDMQDGLARLTGGTIETLDGSITLTGEAKMQTTGIPISAQWTLTNLQLRDALRVATPEGEAPKIAGLLTGQGTASTQATDATANMSGQGELHVRDGRLLVLPGIAEIFQQVGQSASTGGAEFNHRADATFTLSPQGVHFTQSEVVTGVLAARATGTVGYTGTLDLLVNAGPLERIQDALGAIGDIFGKITDRLVKYKVQGTVSQPRVTIAPLGIGG